MPHGPYYLELPTDGGGLRYVDEISWNRVVGGQATWQGDVNGGGFTLSNAVIALDPATIAAAQTPWLQNIDGNNKTLVSVAALGVGTASPVAALDVNGVMRSIGLTAPASGVGVEIGYSSLGYVQAYDRSGGQYGILNVEGLLLRLNYQSGGRVQIGPDLGGTTGALDIYRNTGVENLLRMHYGNVYEAQLGFDTAGNIRACYSPDAAGTMVFGTGAAGSIQVQTSGAARLGIDSAGRITMGNGAADAIVFSGRLTIDGANAPQQFALTFSSAHNPVYLGADTGGALLVRNYAATVIVTIGAGGSIALPYLPSADPGAGTKQLWYDPADSNRVKFAA